ncbi:hypothetical protein M422DRAFT_47244 [Sphaerobolus stellatus SS14]|uniref:Uncharacterized protein n=1 Tax=Sphaerobolus stellatus (strain SS14) TaxID=990650 RepID=A0A0C9W0M3_SPHS4|nr:hypothetical protein M422DRAFT_47244 [Sphaerobolus stellatus SS14]
MQASHSGLAPELEVSKETVEKLERQISEVKNAMNEKKHETHRLKQELNSRVVEGGIGDNSGYRTGCRRVGAEESDGCGSLREDEIYQACGRQWVPWCHSHRVFLRLVST